MTRTPVSDNYQKAAFSPESAAFFSEALKVANNFHSKKLIIVQFQS